MGNISSKIDSIIQVRNSRVSYIENAIANLDMCEEAILKFETLQAKCIKGDLQLEDDIMNRIKNISTKDFLKSANLYREKLQLLQNRFSRKSLHLSLVGRARMGKSLVIQKITGLDSSIIPSADGTDCTGTKSSITNADADDVRAEITFYTEYELVGIINKYLENILNNSNMNISSVSQISSFPIDSIKLDYAKVKENQYLMHLRKYIEHVNDFVFNLGKTITVPKEDIEKYVAQYNHVDPSIRYYNFLGVKGANIITGFNYSDAGKIVLMDTIGIGTTSLGDEDSMLNTVEQDSDAIVFMFRPDSLGPRVSNDEIEVIDKISKRVGPEYAKEMLFWIINKVVDGKGKNIEYISGVVDQINSADWPVSDVYQVDCNNQIDVEQKLLLPILEKISSRIETVDKLIVSNALEAGINVFSEYNELCNEIDTIYYNCNIKNVDRVLGHKMWDAHNSMKNNLRSLYIGKYGKQRYEPCKIFKDACDRTMKQLFSFTPSENEVVDALNTGMDQHATLMFFYDRLRLNIIDAFSTLDQDLSELILDMKNEVLTIFKDERYGKLRYLVNDDVENEDPNKWIESFLDKTDAASEYPIICSSFTKFKDFECTVQGFLIYEIRCRLDRIDQSLQDQLPKIHAGMADKQGIAKDIINIMKDEITKIHDSLRGVLTELSKVPNQAMFATIKDFYDRVFLENRDSQITGDAKRQWEYLFQNWKHILWKDEVEQLLSSQSKAKEINNIVSEIKKHNKKSYFEIIL